jgi:hypothetical protein
MRASLRPLEVALALVALTATLRAAEKRISKSELPAAVQKTAAKQTQGATVLGYTKDTEDGQLQYEVELMSNGHSKDVSIAPDGGLLEVEEQVALTSLSPQVRSGLESKAGKGKITKVESITKHGAIVAYEAQVFTAAKHSEIQVGPEGKPLDHEE